MKTAEENRRDWLEELIAAFGSLAELNVRLDRDRTDATLSQIKNKSPHHKTGKARAMGSEIARDIEEKLGLERGSLDYPPLDKYEIQQQALNLGNRIIGERAAKYNGNPAGWPFETITRFEWNSIPAPVRSMLESQIKAVLPSNTENARQA